MIHNKSVLTFSICGSEGGVTALLLLILRLAGAGIQLLQHSWAQLL